MKKKILLTLGIAILSFSLYGYYLYNKPVLNVKNEEAYINISANELITKFTAEPDNMSIESLDKVIEVSGKISLIENNNGTNIIIMGNGVKCEVAKTEKLLKKDQMITIKGIYSGFDDLFNELSLRRCQIVQ